MSVPGTNGNGVSRGRAAMVRLSVGVVWAAIVGGLMYAGASLFALPQEQLPWIAVLGGAGAVIYVFFSRAISSKAANRNDIVTLLEICCFTSDYR